ncbi:MAG TPA: helix-turn-helix transcriptional regulator [Propionibacteriaceae bacterium]|nr:helix-turn-helix transcriptional regulator [Propionibacteriaceae bacterium]
MARIDGPLVKELREESGTPAKAFAQALKISAPYLSGIEAGDRNLSRRPDLIKAIADELGVPLARIRIRDDGVASEQMAS